MPLDHRNLNLLSEFQTDRLILCGLLWCDRSLTSKKLFRHRNYYILNINPSTKPYMIYCKCLLEFSLHYLCRLYMVQYFNTYADYIAVMNACLICLLLDISRLVCFWKYSYHIVRLDKKLEEIESKLSVYLAKCYIMNCHSKYTVSKMNTCLIL